MIFLVALRDRSSKPCESFIEEVIEVDLKKLNPQADLTEQEPEVGALRRFVQRATQVKLPHNNVDVYIGWWLDQGYIEFPPEFFVLIAEKKWKVTLDIND